MDGSAHDLELSEAAGNGRGGARDSLFLMARFRTVGVAGERDVRVRNLSEGGLMAELDAAPVAGAAVEVEVRGVGWVRGRIAWYAEGRAGIAFDEQIDPMLARKPVGRTAKAIRAR